jgi:cell division FtsZ-interacting protein ZapD
LNLTETVSGFSLYCQSSSMTLDLLEVRHTLEASVDEIGEWQNIDGKIKQMYILLSVNWFIFPSVTLTKTRWTTLCYNAAMESVVTNRLMFHLTILSYCLNIVEY